MNKNFMHNRRGTPNVLCSGLTAEPIIVIRFIGGIISYLCQDNSYWEELCQIMEILATLDSYIPIKVIEFLQNTLTSTVDSCQ